MNDFSTRVELINFYQENEKVLTPTEFAKKFVLHFKDSYLSDLDSTKFEKGICNFAVAGYDSSLEFLAKRLSLISDHSLISQYSQNWVHLYGDQLREPHKSDELTDYALRIDSPDLQGLGKWLCDCAPLIINGNVKYYPRIRRIDYEESEMGYGRHWEEEVADYVVTRNLDAIIRKERIVEVQNDRFLKSSFIKNVISVEFPVIEEVDLRHFSKITADEKSRIEILRDFLRGKFLELEEIQGSESYNAKIGKIGLEIREGVRMIRSEFKEIAAKTSFQVTGAILASSVATLVAINSNILGSYGHLIAPSGGLYPLLRSLENRALAIHNVKDSPYYYFWLLSRKAR